MSQLDHLTRRSFLKVIGGVGASFALGCYAVPATTDGKKDKGVAFAPSAFLKIDPDGSVTVTISRSDMGQGVRTTFAMIVAEELDADWTKVKVVQAPANSALFGGQGTGGSSSVRSMYQNLRAVGAGARSMLIAAAAKEWNVDPSTCKTEKGKVVSSTGKSISYGDLTTHAAGMPIPAAGDAPLKDKTQFKILGKRTTRVDNPAVVEGSAVYGMDVKVPGALYAVISRRPAFGASVKSFDDAEARKVPGVVDVVQIGSGVAVVAQNTWAAIKGRDALKFTWEPGPNVDVSTAKLREALKATVGKHLDMPAGSKEVTADYELPYLAHATMEPMNATADVRDDQCIIWAPTQSPDGAQNMVGRMLNLTSDKVTVNVTLLGGGFGRRSNPDFIAEAVQVSKAAKKPIKLLWTREDDMKNDSYRPMSQHSFKGAVDAGGAAVGWSHQMVNAGGRARPMGTFGRAGLPYSIADAGMAQGGAASPVPTGPWRSVEHSQIIVVNECFIDELAHAAGKDPYEFRKGLIKDDKLNAVLALAAEKGDWGKPLPAGHGRGIACFSGYGSNIAHVIEVSVEGKEVKLHRVTIAVDPGLALNPGGVEAQVQGACVDGLSTALRAAITIDKGGVVENSWTDYQWMTMDAMPKIDVHIIESGGEPGGMGEVGYPSVMPAVANAVFAATGKRVRKFPIKIEELA